MIYEVTLTKLLLGSESTYVDASEHSVAEEWARDQKEAYGADSYSVHLRLPSEVPNDCALLRLE